MQLDLKQLKHLLFHPVQFKSFLRFKYIYIKETVLERVKGIDLVRDVYLDELGLDKNRSFYYINSGNLYLEKVLNTLNITSNDSIIDFGCGKGGAIIKMAKYPFSKIGGVELSPKMQEIAEKNIKKLGLKNIELFFDDASKIKDIDQYNHIYFYNPFPHVVMEAVIENVKQSLTRSPRKVTIIYKAPHCHETIISDGVFQKIAEFEADADYNKFYLYSNQ